MTDIALIKLDDLRRIVRDEMAALLEQQRREAPPPSEWIQVHEFAARHKVTVRTVNNWVASGRVEARGAGPLRQIRVKSFRPRGHG